MTLRRRWHFAAITTAAEMHEITYHRVLRRWRWRFP